MPQKKTAKKSNTRSRSRSRNTSRQPKKRTRGGGSPPQKKKVIVPKLGEGNVRIIPLGGVEEIGRNMTAIEIGDDIIVIDCGFAFGGDVEMPGVDYILPNTEYLEQNRDKIRAMLITHGHLDHTGGIPYIIDRIGNPPIYTRKLTGVMIKKRQEEFPQLPKLDIREIEKDEIITLGAHKIRFFAVTHTIPDSMGIAIETPYGDIVTTGDVKLTHKDGVVSEEETREYGQFKNRDVLCLLMDSTAVWKPGWSVPESTVFGTFEDIIPKAEGRLIIGAFASQLERLMKIIRITESCGKKIVVDGRSMVTNIEIVRELGLLKHKDSTIIPISAMDEYPPEKLVILVTGAQGDRYASLMRIGNKTHKFIRLTPTDTVVLSSSVIPGNEVAVQRLKDLISRQGTRIVTFNTSDVHASGHGSAEEAKWIHRQIKPKFFIPQHGHHFMLRTHADLIQESIDIPKENIAVPDNSSIIEIQDKGTKIVTLKEKAPDAIRVIEGHHMSELSGVLMRDRKALSQEGFLVVVATVDRRTGKLQKSPDIISRGFVYLRENTDLMNQTRLIISKQVTQMFGRSARGGARNGNLDDAKDKLAETVSRFLLQQTQKRPMVIPVIVSV